MSIFSEKISKIKADFSAGKTKDEQYYTYVEGVGSIPRDIYKHVKSDPMGDLPRYSIHIVIQHLLIFITFLLLAGTGVPIYFSDLFWAPYVIWIFGGIDTARLIHRIAAFIMIATSGYHLVTVIGGTIQKIIKREFDIKRTQIPRLEDLFDLIHDLRYFFGREQYRPKMEKFMYKQKLHYLAILYGSFVLMTAGSALLYPDIITKYFSGVVDTFLPHGTVDPETIFSFLQDLARLMHADEAVMALIVLAFWHWTNVHLVPGRFPVQWIFLTGKITREHQIEEHFLEYLRNLQEIPEEREYMKNLLKELGIGSPQKNFVSGQEAVSPKDPDLVTAEE